MSGRDASQTSTAQPADAGALLLPAHGSGAICPSVDAIALPRLDESDGFAGTLASTLSQHPRVVAWLATDDLIRRFVVVVDAVASGKSPALHLGALRPSRAFRTAERDAGLFADPRNYERFAPIADAVHSVDVEAAVRVCSALKPRLDEAYMELGRGGTFDSALERVIVSLLQTPAVGADARLGPQGARYGFEDPALESLMPAQKHLARMGTRHARVIQDELRQQSVEAEPPGQDLRRHYGQRVADSNLDGAHRAARLEVLAAESPLRLVALESRGAAPDEPAGLS
jgi:hypothetical protein